MNHPAGDMITSIMHLPSLPDLPDGVVLKRAMGLDRQKILQYIRDHFSEDWINEAGTTLASCPSRCVVAVKDEQIIGFACWDTTAKGFFGPIGVSENCRGSGIGSALLLRTLAYMRDDGYAYAIIGWVADARPFYEKVVNAVYIPGGTPNNSAYSQLIRQV